MRSVPGVLCITLHCFEMDFPEPVKRLILSHYLRYPTTKLAIVQENVHVYLNCAKKFMFQQKCSKYSTTDSQFSYMENSQHELQLVNRSIIAPGAWKALTLVSIVIFKADFGIPTVHKTAHRAPYRFEA